MGKIEEASGEKILSEHRSGKKIFFSIIFLLLLMVVAGIAFLFSQKQKPPIQVQLADGRILQIEGVTYGTHHQIGIESLIVKHFGPWLPGPVNNWLGSGGMKGTIDLERPGLVVWVNALSAVGGTNVDCQGIRVEFVDKHGDLFGEETRSWFGHPRFWRVGHVFYCYPQDEKELKFQVTSWKKPKGKKNEPVLTQFKNPHVAQPVQLSGRPLPQSKTIGDMEVVLKTLTTRTNGNGKYYKTPARYFEPVFEFRRGNQPALGWEKPEWIAEDAIGNRGQFLGIHAPALKFFATVYPQATNFAAAKVLATLPKVDLTILRTNLFWNKKTLVGTNEIVVLGIFPLGTHTFVEGVFESSSPSVSGPGGGAPSGWTGMSRRLNPLQVKILCNHYTPHPTIYVQAPHLNATDRLAVRLQDGDGKYWIAEPDPGGSSDGIYPFLVDVPDAITNFVAEVVLLKPIQANFLVQTGSKN